MLVSFKELFVLTNILIVFVLSKIQSIYKMDFSSCFPFENSPKKSHSKNSNSRTGFLRSNYLNNKVL